jgi:protein FAM98B
LLSNLPKNYLGSPLLNAILDESQWEKLIQINQMLSDDFQMRRELLLTRLDVTIQSFKWAERLKKNNTEIATIYQQKRKEFSIRQNVKIYYILAARDGRLKLIHF